jgi:hypothetical protein
MPCSLPLRRLAIVVALLLTHGCATRVQVPPRVTLASWDTVGIVQFAGSSAPRLTDLATGEFVRMLHAAQPGARILELGPEARLLDEIGHRELDFEAVRALGDRFGVDAVFTGTLEMSELKPDVRLGQAFTSVRAAANVNGRLSTRLLETRSGAGAWSGSATASANVARVGASTDGGLPSFRVTDPRDAQAGLIPTLVDHLHHDFHPTWRKER